MIEYVNLGSGDEKHTSYFIFRERSAKTLQNSFARTRVLYVMEGLIWAHT
jgi:hypothetical protein